MSKDELGDRMKSYEAEYDMILSKENCIVLRLDGRSFSSFTKKFTKPFSYVIGNSMAETTKKLVDEFSASFGYTQSDEISIVIPFRQTKWGDYRDHIFGGRAQKIATVASSLAAVVFDREISRLGASEKFPMFDCRVMSMNKDEACNAIYWRALDARKNAVSSLYRHTFGHAKMQGKNRLQMIEELGKIWEDLDSRFKHGVFVYGDMIGDDVRYSAISEDSPFWTSHAERYHEIFFEEIELLKKD